MGFRLMGLLWNSTYSVQRAWCNWTGKYVVKMYPHGNGFTYLEHNFPSLPRPFHMCDFNPVVAGCRYPSLFIKLVLTEAGAFRPP